MRRHVLPIVALLITLLLLRQVYPYVSGQDPTVVDGYEVREVAGELGGPTCLVWPTPRTSSSAIVTVERFPN